LLALAACSGSADPPARAIVAGVGPITCVNAASGARSAILLDETHRLAGGQPAAFTGGSVSWRDPAGGGYELDRASGVLTITRASSTGGYQTLYACAPAAP
jgi:hypothetical protein